MTLVELIAALAIAGIVLLGAVLLLQELDDSARRVQKASAAITENETGRRRFARLLRAASVETDSSARFVGSDDSIAFWARCATPRGWMTRCRARLTIAPDRKSVLVTTRLGDGREVTAEQRCRTGVRLRYFDAERAVWRAAWDATATLPAALAIVHGADTAIYSIGPGRD